jgi:hypothetical protein
MKLRAKKNTMNVTNVGTIYFLNPNFGSERLPKSYFDNKGIISSNGFD